MYKVLIVDDEPFILDGLKVIVKWEEFGLEISNETVDGEKALQILETTKIHILITDIKMPIMDGIELVKKVKVKYPDIKVIILSGYDDFEYVKEAAILGIENYLLKPLDEDELSSTLTNTVEKIEGEIYKKIQLKDDINVLRENILYRWVTNSIGLEELRKRAPLLGLQIGHSSYMVCILKVMTNEGFYGKGSMDMENNSSLALIAVMNICTETFQDSATVEIFSTTSGEVVFIFYDTLVDIDRMHVNLLMEKCSLNINKYLKLDVFITIGSLCNSFKTLFESYKNAVKLMDYSLILPPNSIVDYEASLNNSNNFNKEITLDFNELKSKVIEKNINGLVNYIDKLFNNLKSLKGVTPEFLKNITSEIIFAILNAANISYSKPSNFSNDTSNLFLKTYEMKHIDELATLVKAVSLQAVNHLTAMDKNANPLVKRLLDYITEKYTEEISLKTLASSFNMNALYLGQIFKNHTGEMFSNYINKIRIEKAKELLISSKYTSNEIANKVGYSNPNHFYLTFKKLVGLSPSEFKKANL